jgi:uncharacterized protein YlxP (DUF503 family)
MSGACLTLAGQMFPAVSACDNQVHMVIGVCRVTLHLPASHSLKDRRQVVRSLLARLRNRFNIAVAEVDDQDRWQIATIGLVCVSSSATVADEVLTHALEYIEDVRLDAMVTEVAREITHAL